MKDKEGFGLPFLNTAPDAGMRQILLPFSHNERIVGSTLYKILDTEWIAGNKAGISEGASCSFYGDPTLYGFMFTPNGRFYVATRQILTPVLTNWLRAGNFQASEDTVQQADAFCTGKIPKAVQVQEAEMELQRLAMNSPEFTDNEGNVNRQRLN